MSEVPALILGRIFLAPQLKETKGIPALMPRFGRRILNSTKRRGCVPQSPTIFRFGDFEVDLRAGWLRKRGLRIKIPTQCFQVLAILLQHAGEPVTREDLRQRLWPKDVFVSFDANLNTAIARLREALNDSAESPRFIETLPKYGYRFVANLSTVAEPKPGLVVLPFANLGGDPTQEYFADAITEEIISALTALASGRLAVIARSTAMHYKSSQKDVSEIGRELRVDYIVEGSVHRITQRIRVSVQLIRASDEMHLWANCYDGDLQNVFSIESTAAQAIAGQLGITPARAVRKPTEDLVAYDLYIQGRRYLDAGNPPEAFAKARQFFDQAVARDPEFALAYDSLAELYWYMGFFGFVPPKEALSTGLFHALRALEIDGTLADTHALLAQYRKQLDFDWSEVRREMNLARKLNSASPVVRLRHAVTGLMPHGRIDEAICELERALESDPMSRWVRVWLAAMLWFGRQYDQLIEQGRLLLELDPTYYMGHFAIGVGCREKRLFDESIAAHRKATEFSGGAPMMVGWLGLALAASGNTAEARAILARLHAIPPNIYVPPTSFAWIHLGLEETGEFFNWMNRAIDARDHMITPILSYPFLDPIRSDPRYLDLLRRMNLKS